MTTLMNIPITTDVAIWTYWKKSRPEVKQWHMTADDAAAIALRDTFKGMKEGTCAYAKTVALNNDLAFAKRAGNSRKAVMGQIAIFKYAPHADAQLFNIIEANDQLLIEFGPEYLDKLHEGMCDMLNEYGGYAIGETCELTFWWWKK